MVNPGLTLRAPRTVSLSVPASRLATAARRSPEMAGAAVLVVIGLVAYRFTLVSLGADLRLDTPLAYLPLLPLFSAYLAVDAVRRYRGQPRPPREGLIDLLVGVPLLVVSLLLITALPVISSTYYWSDRPDVLSLALFMVGSVSLLFGLGWVWRLRWALVFLLLMWPGLYLHALTGVLSGFSTATNDALNLLVVHLPFGVHSGGSTGLLLVPQHGSVTPLAVSVSSACAGSDTGLGFALVGGAVLTTRRGPIWRRMAWLALGIVGAFALNVGRISSILLIARYGSAHFALDGYHAVVGLILFTGLIMVMVWLLPRVGLTPAASGVELGAPPAAAEVALVRGQVPATSVRADPLAALHQAIDALTAPIMPAPAAAAARPRPTPYPAATAPDPAAVVAARVAATQAAAPAALVPAPERPRRRRAPHRRGPRRSWWARPLAVAVLALLCGLADAQLGPYAAFADGNGAPTVATFSAGQLPHGWTAVPVATYPWAGQYFGGGTNWTRYALSSPGSGSVVADVVITPDQSAFDAYGVESCFRFHRYRVLTHDRTDLGAGVTGLSLDYATSGAQWSTVSWAWPVRANGRTEYERVLLTASAGTSLPTPTTTAVGRTRSAGFMARFVVRIADGVTSRAAVTAAPVAYRSTNAGLLGIAQGLVHTALTGPRA